MPAIAHFIVTRFNMRAAPDSRPAAISPAWLRGRMELFDRFCWPTVSTQTRRDFRWLVLCDSETPQTIRDELDSRRKAWPGFEPVYQPPIGGERARKAVLERLPSRPGLLITTRLDSDDGLRRDYVQRVRELVDAHADIDEPVVLDFPDGYVWHRDRIYVDRQRHSPFSTLIEPVGARSDYPIRTIYSGSHLDVDQLGRVLTVPGPSWVQVVHGSNLDNIKRGIRRPMSSLNGEFAIDYESIARRESVIGLALDRVASATIMAGRTVVASIRPANKRRMAG